jgi:TrmH family RNA methyltransferase
VTIDSVKDPIIQTARALGTRSGRAAAGRGLADGIRLVTQIIESGSTVDAVLVPDGPVDDILAERAAAAGVPLHPVRPGVLRRIIGSATPPDCLAIVPLGPETAATTPTGRLTVICERVLDPGNLGSIIRTAYGLGCADVVLSGAADASSRRVIEASRGAVLRVGLHRFADGRSAIEALRHDGWLVVAADGSAGLRIDDVDVPGGRAAVVVGNETDGLTRAVREAADIVAGIELDGEIESLNVAVATGIALYTLRRRLPGRGLEDGARPDRHSPTGGSGE